MKRKRFSQTIYQKESFPSKESDTKILQSTYFAYWMRHQLCKVHEI